MATKPIFVLCLLWMLVVVNPPLQCSSQEDEDGDEADKINDPPICGIFMGGTPVEVGTNKYLSLSTAKANFPPNGIDFPNSEATGRSSDGYTMADYIAMQMGRNFSPPPYFSVVAGSRDSSESDLDIFFERGGLNFASSGSGVFNETGKERFGQVVPLGTQVNQFMGLARDLRTALNRSVVDAYLRDCVYCIATGSTDIAEQLDNPSFMDTLFLSRFIREYIGHIQDLYNIAARRMVFITPPPVGCTPSGRAMSPNGSCNARANALSGAIPTRLALAMRALSLRNRDMTYSIANSNDMVLDIIRNYSSYGITNVIDACCGNGTTPCTPNSTLCEDRIGHLYWNRYQLSQSGAALVIDGAFSNNSRYTTPVNFDEVINSR